MLFPYSALVINSLTAYTLTFVIASSSLTEPARHWIACRTPRLKLSLKHPHFIDCRMCVGFWVAVVVCNTDWGMILPVYGLSYFLATQER